LSNIPAGYSYEIWGLNSGIPYPIALGQTIVMDYTNDNTKICIRLKNVTPPMSSDMFDGNLIVDSVNIELIAGYWADLGAGCSFVGGAVGLNDTLNVDLPIHDCQTGASYLSPSSYTVNMALCYIANDATIELFNGPSNPYDIPNTSIQWDFNSGYQMGNLVTGLLPGNYSYVIIDSTNGCSYSDTIEVGSLINALSPAVVVVDNASCNISGDGSIQLFSGGAIPYNFPNTWIQWDLNTGGQTGNIATNLNPGSYSFLITESTFGCTYEDTINVSNLNLNDFPIDFYATQTLFTNPPFADQFFNTTLNSSDYDFTWDFGDGAQMVSNSSSVFHEYTYNGLYTVMLIAESNASGCIDTLVFTDYIFCTGGVSCLLSANINPPGLTTACQGDSILLSCNTGLGYSYQWYLNSLPLPGAIASAFYATSTGNYQVAITDASCTDFSNNLYLSFSSGPPPPAITATGILTFCSGDSVILTASFGYNAYEWSTGSTGQSITVYNSGTFFVTGYDPNNCGTVSLPFDLNASFIEPQQICLVGVDSATNKNIIIWEKPITLAIDSFYIYKETIVLDYFEHIGSVHYDSMSVFIDYASNPSAQANRYRISILDSCGIETLQGDIHKTIHLTISQGIGNTWNLMWNHYSGFSYGTYNIYRGTSPLNMTLLTSVASSLNSFTDLTPPLGLVYYQIEVVSPIPCTPTRAIDYTRSNIVASDVVTGMQEIYGNNILLFPNPATNQISLIIPEVLIGKPYQILDYSGRQVRAGMLTEINSIIDISSIAKGVYIIQIGEQKMSLKLVKE
jgi:hypothetical protein